jgi:hypothetical protein
VANKVHSVIDLLDSFFGAVWTADMVDSLSLDELDALAQDVNNFYASYSVPSNQSGLRCYSGGATFTANIQRPSEGSATQLAASQLLPFAHAATLYADQIVVDCPLDAWIYSYRDFPSPQQYWGNNGLGLTLTPAYWVYGDGFFNSTEDESRARIRAALGKLEVLAPAIRAGWILPVPHLRIWKDRKYQIATQVRKDVLDLSMLDVIKGEYVDPPAQSDVIRGMAITPEGGFRSVDNARAIIESPAIYFNSVMAVADATDSRFVPTADSDFALVRQRISDAGKLNRAIRDGLAVGSLHQVLVPSFENFSFDTICDIRQSEQSFADWRDGIRELSNGDTPISESNLADYGEIMTERLANYVASIKADIARSSTLKGRLESIKPEAIDWTIAATMWMIPPQSPVLKLVESLAAPLVRRALKSIVSPQGSAKSVIIKLGRA